MAPLLNVLLFAGAALASPLNIHGVPGANAGTFSFTQVPKSTKVAFNGPLSIKKTYLKYGVPVPEWLESAVANHTAFLDGEIEKRATGSAVTTPIDAVDDAYVTPVQIGTPAQTLNLDFDTGSSDLWVFSSETPSSEVDGQTVYTPSKSSTSTLLSGATWSISYGDGSTSSGDVYTDKVTIGGLTVASQAVEQAKTVSSSFTSESETDGLLGLAFSTLNTVSPTPQKTFFDNAKASLDSTVFTADLKRGAPGTYNFGFIDSTKYTGSITYAAISTSQGFWQFSSSGYAVGSAAFTSTTISGIADTGTTLLYLPTAVVSAYWKQVTGSSNSASAGGYVYPCSTTPPNFTFGVGSARIVIPGSYMNFGAVDTAGTSCFGGLQSSSAIGINIFGDVALKAAFVVFDGASTPRIGWASKNL